MAGLGELVVRGAGDDAALDTRDGRVVQRRAERARREHVAVDVEDLIERNDLRAELAVRALGLERVDVGDGELRARPRGAPCTGGSRRARRPAPRRGCPRAKSFPSLNSTHASMPRRTPSAVNGDGSPDPPCDGSTPVTCLVTVRMTSMSSRPVPLSSAVM